MKFELFKTKLEISTDITPYGTIPLHITANHRDCFLDVQARELLDLSDGVYDFETQFGTCPAEKQKALEEGLVLLDAFGAARIVYQSPDSENSYVCRIAGEKDYRGISELINASGVTLTGVLKQDREYMNQDAIRMRQFNNEEYYFLLFRKEQLRAVLLAAMPSMKSYSAAFRLGGIAFRQDESFEDIGKILIRYSIQAFGDEFRICRYLCFDEDDPVPAFLKTMGFMETARLENETPDGGQAVIYDLNYKKIQNQTI